MKDETILIRKLIEEETSKPEASQSWLENQYPAQPKDRLKKSNYLNYDNLKPFENLEKFVREHLNFHPKEKIVVLAIITKTKRLCKRPIAILRENDSLYYPQFELFASAYHLSGFVELFHNTKIETT